MISGCSSKAPQRTQKAQKYQYDVKFSLIISGFGQSYFIAFYTLLNMSKNSRIDKAQCVQCRPPPTFSVLLLSHAQRSTPLHSLAVVKRCVQLLLYFY